MFGCQSTETLKFLKERTWNESPNSACQHWSAITWNNGGQNNSIRTGYVSQSNTTQHSLWKKNELLKKEFLNLNRQQWFVIKSITCLMTGHYNLKKHLHKMGIFKDGPICPLCLVGEESASHVTFDFEILRRWR